MRRAVFHFVFVWRYAWIATGAGLLVLMSCLILLAGAHNTTEIPWYFGSAQEYIGMLLLLILMPAYLATSAVLALRRTAELAVSLDEQYATGLAEQISRVKPGPVLIAMTMGFAYAVLFNIPGNGLHFFSAPASEKLTMFGQSLIWIMFAAFLYLRVHTSNQFRRAGAIVPIDLFETSGLRPFARVGLIDALIIACGLVLSTVQSLDFSFRPDNYSKALIIALPALAFLMVNPMWQVHRRLADLRNQELSELNRKITETSKQLESPDMEALEILLQRRQRTMSLSTWPIDVSVLQRLVFYIIIPPLAWVGAALVESLVDQFITQ